MKRLDKFLVEMSVASRSVIKEMAKKGRITVNGEVVKASDIKIDENSDVIAVDGMIIAFSDMEYFMLNKPAGVITATMDKKAETVLDLIDERTRNDLFPVGRLDKDTEGLLLITNDGDLAHRLLAPKKHVDKVYYADIHGLVTKEHVELFSSGITLLDGTTVMALFEKQQHSHTLDAHPISEPSRAQFQDAAANQHQSMLQDHPLHASFLPGLLLPFQNYVKTERL